MIEKIKIIDEVLFKNQTNPIYFLVIEIEFINKCSECYFMFLTSVETNSELEEKIMGKIINQKGQDSFLIDALYSPSACKQLIKFFSSNKMIQGREGAILVNTTRFSKKILEKKDEITIKPLDKDQSNTSILYGDSALLKMYRLSENGINPEVEINQFLLASNRFISPKLAVTIDYVNKQKTITAGIIQEYIPNLGDGWNYSLKMIANIWEELQNSFIWQQHKELVYPWDKINPVLPEEVIESLGVYAHSVKHIAQKTAEMHLALVGSSANKSFEPENFSLFDQRSLYQSLRSIITKTEQLISNKELPIDESLQKKLDKVIRNKNKLIYLMQYLISNKLGGKKIRCHGDFHLGQILYTLNDFIIIDYEGEPCRSLSERKIKYPPIKDIAGMFRSFHYAIHTALNKKMTHSSYLNTELWYSWICTLFIKTYLNYPNINSLLPKDNESFSLLLKAYMLEKVFYEIHYEINNRPDWVYVPCIGLLNLVDGSL